MEIEIESLGPSNNFAKPAALPGAPISAPSNSRPLNGNILIVANRIVTDLQAVSSRLDPEATDIEPVTTSDVLSVLKLAILGITELLHAIATSSNPDQPPTYAGVVTRSALSHP